MSGMNQRAPVALGVDIGSTNVKVAVVRMDGGVAARRSRPTPRDSSNLSVSALTLLDVLEDMIIDACGSEYGIQAVSIAGIGEDGVLVDQTLTPLVPAMAWFDTRRNALFGEIESKLPAASGIGVATDPSRTLTGWLWARQQPGTEAAFSWLALTDYVSSRWAATTFMSDTLAARTGAWDLGERKWNSERVVLCLGNPELLPPVCKTGEVIGKLRSLKLQAAGVVMDSAVVVAGGHDHPIGGWGVSQMHAGAVLDSMGTAEVVVAQSPVMALGRTDIDVSPGIGNNASTLLCVQELSRNVSWASADKDVAVALRKIISGEQEPDSYLNSDCFVPGARGGVLPYYSAAAPSSALSRASAVAGALSRLGNEAVEAVARQLSEGAPIYCAGGWARSPGWIRLKQLLRNTEVKVICEPEVTAVGAALLAAAAINIQVDAATALAGDTKPCLPNRKTVSVL